VEFPAKQTCGKKEEYGIKAQHLFLIYFKKRKALFKK